MNCHTPFASLVCRKSKSRVSGDVRRVGINPHRLLIDLSVFEFIFVCFAAAKFSR
jgi:hypothetical protein